MDNYYDIISVIIIVIILLISTARYFVYIYSNVNNRITFNKFNDFQVFFMGGPFVNLRGVMPTTVHTPLNFSGKYQNVASDCAMA